MKRLLAAAALSSLALAGCMEPKESERSVYAAKADRICMLANAKVGQLPKPKSAKQLKDQLKLRYQVGRELQAKIDRLKVPEEKRQVAERWKAQIGQIVSITGQASRSDLDSRKLPKAAEGRLAQAQAAYRKLSAQYGFTYCGVS